MLCIWILDPRSCCLHVRFGGIWSVMCYSMASEIIPSNTTQQSPMECTTTSLSKSEVDTVAGDRSLIYGIVIMTTFTDCLSSGLSIGPVRVAADSPGSRHSSFRSVAVCAMRSRCSVDESGSVCCSCCGDLCSYLRFAYRL